MAANHAGRSIFISYRRADTEGEAGRLFDDLTRAYGDASVFMDVSGIEPGADFRKAIEENVSGCGVLLAIIGPSWATVQSSDGGRRLDSANDYVRLEIATALGKGIPVIPVLVHGARMPALELLPENLTDLRYRNSVELTHARWNSDVALLVAALKNYVAEEQAHPLQPVHATLPVQLPPPQPPPEMPVREASKSKMPLYVMGGVGLAIAVGAGLFAAFGHRGETVTPTVTPTVQQVPAQAGAATPAPAAVLVGTWRRAQDAATGGDELQQIAFRNAGGQLMVHAWSQCSSGQCDWGEKAATLESAGALTESFEPRNTPAEIKQTRSAVLTIEPAGNGLKVTVTNTFHEKDGSTVNTGNQLHFLKMP